jgi:hypothetical protein
LAGRLIWPARKSSLAGQICLVNTPEKQIL